MRPKPSRAADVLYDADIEQFGDVALKPQPFDNIAIAKIDNQDAAPGRRPARAHLVGHIESIEGDPARQ